MAKIVTINVEESVNDDLKHFFKDVHEISSVCGFPPSSYFLPKNPGNADLYIMGNANAVRFSEEEDLRDPSKATTVLAEQCLHAIKRPDRSRIVIGTSKTKTLRELFEKIKCDRIVESVTLIEMVKRYFVEEWTPRAQHGHQMKFEFALKINFPQKE